MLKAALFHYSFTQLEVDGVGYQWFIIVPFLAIIVMQKTKKQKTPDPANNEQTSKRHTLEVHF